MADAPEKPDFFISYNHADERWATWIATVLEAAGYKCVIQIWDFRPGANFVLEMQKAAESAARTIAVLTPAYLGSDFTAPEWAVSFAGDPRGISKSLVPIRVEPCEPPGLLSTIIYIDLVGINEVAVTAMLLGGVAPGRAKPASPAPFPGHSVTAPSTVGPSHGDRSPKRLTWEVVAGPSAVVWRAAGQQGGVTSNGSLVEVHLVPVPEQRLAVRDLQALPAQLTAAGRRGGFFGEALGVFAEVRNGVATAHVNAASGVDASGLLVARSGQRGGWLALPHDSLGSVLDQDELRPRVAGLLAILLDLSMDLAERYALAVGLSDVMMLSIGDSRVVGRRSGVSMQFASSGDVVLDAEDSATSAALIAYTDEVAEEVTARLIGSLRDKRSPF